MNYMNMKKIFLIIFTASVFFIPSFVFAETGCCRLQHIKPNGSIGRQENIEESTCKNSTDYYSWIAGPCSTPSTSATVPPINSSQPGCVITGGQEVCTLDNPLEGNKTQATSIISNVIKGALGIVGALTLLMLVWGGFEWLTSAGNPEKVKAGTQTMIWAMIGVLLVFGSYILLSTFTGYLTGTP